MTPPRVSIVIPAYNHARYLAQAIDSILAQTCPNLDCRVIDDGSSDATPAVLARYVGRLGIETQPNMGQGATLNRAWAAAEGRYLAYLGDDDRLHPECVARMVDVLEGDPRIACAYPDFALIDGAGRTIAGAVGRPFDLAAMMVQGINPVGQGAVFRASAFRAIGGWRTDVALGADRDFWARMTATGRIAFVPQVLAEHRVHPGSLSRARISEARACDFLRVTQGYFARADVPTDIRAREAEAMASSHREVARRLLHSGLVGAAIRHRQAAARYAPAARPVTVRARPDLGRSLRIARALFA